MSPPQGLLVHLTQKIQSIGSTNKQDKKTHRDADLYGFGISNEDQVKEVSGICDGVIMASKLLKDLDNSPTETATKQFARHRKFKNKTIHS